MATGIIRWLLIVGALTIVFLVIGVIVAFVWAGTQNEIGGGIIPEVRPAVYASIRHGDTEADVLRTTGGEPEKTDEILVGERTLECWYYAIAAASGTYRFCFQDGRLVSKSRTAGEPGGR